MLRWEQRLMPPRQPLSTLGLSFYSSGNPFLLLAPPFRVTKSLVDTEHARSERRDTPGRIAGQQTTKLASGLGDVRRRGPTSWGQCTLTQPSVYFVHGLSPVKIQQKSRYAMGGERRSARSNRTDLTFILQQGCNTQRFLGAPHLT